MATTYVRNASTGEFELVGPGGATTDTTLSLAGKPADAAAVGSALTNYATTADLSNKSDTDHTHTAADVGALPYIDARGEEYDMDVILASGTHYNTYRYNNTTLHTPYTDGLSSYSSGLIVSCAVGTGSGKQIAYANGEDCIYERSMKSGVVGSWCVGYNSGHKPTLSELGAAADEHTHNTFSSLTEIGITTFPTTMQLVSEAMPANSMIIIDTRRINGTGSDYETETISDWGNTANGVAIITKGVSTARIGMLILYGTTATTSANIHYGSYAHDANNVNWVNIDERYVNKISNYSAVDLNTLTDPGLYYVSSGTTDLHFPAGSNGHMLVMSDGSRIRQVFFRMGTIDSNSFQWYSRNRSSVTTEGLDGDGWSQWWLLSGCEIAWSGTAKLNTEINLGSRYGCQAWVVAGQVTETDTFSTVYIPRYFLTTSTTKHKMQIADETGYVSFYFYYKESDNNVYAKVVWVSDTDNSALRYVYRVS